MNGLSSVALNMVGMPTRGSMGSVHRDKGRTALVASKLTAIACRWASLYKGTSMGVYNRLPTDATRALFLPFPLVWGYFFLDIASRSTIRMLAKLTALACLAEVSSKPLADGPFRLPSAANAAPPAPYLAKSLSSPYFKYASIWIYGIQHSRSRTVSRWAILSSPRMVTYASRRVRVS